MKNIYKIITFSILVIIHLYSNSQSKSYKTQVMILGTYHLNQIDNFQPAMLDQLIAKLDSFNFDVICIENMPPQLLYDIQSRNDSTYINVLESFGGIRLNYAQIAQNKYNISFLDAQNKIVEMLSKPSLTAKNRMSLIKYFIASADLASAVLQYNYLKNNTSIDTTEIEEFIDKLDKLSNSSNEIYSLALKLALKIGLLKVNYIDNFQDEALLMKYYPDFIIDYLSNQEKLKNISNHPVYQKTAELLERCQNQNDLLDLFLYLNSKEYQKQDIEAQWEIWFNTDFESGSDLGRYSLWEMRNLQIAANIMEITAQYPGKNILVIIGASHKSFLEKHLKTIPLIELIDFK